MEPDQTLASHLQQLRSSKPLYAMLDRLPSEQARREAGRLIDLIVSEELTAPKDLDIPEPAVAAARAAVQAAHPDRKCMEYVLASFGGWFDAVPETSREAFLAAIPKLAPGTRDLGDTGMRLLLDAGAKDPRVFAPVAAYAMTTPDSIRAAARLAGPAASHGRADLLETMATLLTLEKMEESRDAEFLLPAMQAMVDASAAWPEAMQLAVALTERNFSSARGAAKELPAKLQKLPAERHAAYLEDFRRIVESIGLRAIGFCLNTLPGLYATHDVDKVRSFVDLGCRAGDSFGALAGEAFLERKTEAARASL